MQLETLSKPTDSRPRCIAYIDGYNWYHAIFKHHPELKWLNVHSFFQALRPRENVVMVKLFSAMIKEVHAHERQKRYFDALKTLPNVKVILGFFQDREVTCRSECGKKYWVPEEKKTDVNIAVELMSDAIEGRCDRMCIATADSDIQPAVEWVAQNRRNIGLTVYVPALAKDQRDRRTDYYRTKGLNVDCMFMPLNGLKEHQMDNKIKLPENKLAIRPHCWAIPATA